MYPVALEIRDNAESNTFASYLDCLLSVGWDGQLHFCIYDKHDHFNFHITNFPFLSSDIQLIPAYKLRLYLEAYTLCPSCNHCIIELFGGAFVLLL